MSYVDWHREMLADKRRVCAFAQAVRQAVRPGEVVADVGTGTGLLAMVAARAGAGQVFAIDRGPIIEVARQIAADNGLAERITFLRAEARDLRLPERADLVVGEIIGSFGVEENILEVFTECRQSLLKAGGRLLPDRLDLCVAPTSIGSELVTWTATLSRDLGLDLRALEAMARHTPAGMRAGREHLLAPGEIGLVIDLAHERPDLPEGESHFTVRRPGRMCGLLGWFMAVHQGRALHSTEPPNRGSSWANTFLPTGDPVEVEAGQKVAVKLGYDDPFLSWEIEVEGHEARAFHQFRGVPADELLPSDGEAANT